MPQEYLEALDNVTWYNGLARSVLRWLDLTPDYGSKFLTPQSRYGADDLADWLQLQVIWMIAVSLFGDWGTSPRFGWIEDVDGFREWVLKITETWRSSDRYDGPEEYRIKEERWYDDHHE